MSPSDDSIAGITSDKLTLKQGKDTLPKEGPRCRRLPTVKKTPIDKEINFLPK